MSLEPLELPQGRLEAPAAVARCCGHKGISSWKRESGAGVLASSVFWSPPASCACCWCLASNHWGRLHAALCSGCTRPSDIQDPPQRAALATLPPTTWGVTGWAGCLIRPRLPRNVGLPAVARGAPQPHCRRGPPSPPLLRRCIVVLVSRRFTAAARAVRVQSTGPSSPGGSCVAASAVGDHC